MQRHIDSPSSASSPGPSFGSFSAENSHERLHMLNENEQFHDSSRRNRWSRQYIYLGVFTLAIVSTLGFFASLSSSGGAKLVPEPSIDGSTSQTPTVLSSGSLDPLSYLRGPPTQRFRDNLRPDAKYITSWISAGWTNDVMTYINLIYLGLITDRIPIIPMFVPSHIGGDKPPINFGEVFNVTRLINGLGKPVLEWHQVKNLSDGALDELGCWNTWEAVQENEAFPRRSPVPKLLKLDLSYTKAPTWIKVIPHYRHDFHSYFWALASLAFPETRAENLVPPLESPINHVLLPPDEQLLCYDYLYYVCAHQPFEFEFEFSPAWRYVGQYAHWTEKLEDIADEYVRRTLGVSDNSTTPPYISVHIRHGDFKNNCGEVPIAECFAPVSAIVRRVEEVKSELQETRGITVEHVIMTSDERDEDWWEEIKNHGWYRVDHSMTVQKYGDWYPVFIDAVIQSNGIGFVGTDRSTMSMLARRRVQSWHNGVDRTLKWGKPNADDH